MQRREERGAGEGRRRPAGAGRVPPHNLPAEESVLGAILLSRDALGAVVEAGLRYDDFYRPAHQHIFDVACAVSQNGSPVDTITVAEELSRLGLLEQVGGVEARAREELAHMVQRHEDHDPAAQEVDRVEPRSRPGRVGGEGLPRGLPGYGGSGRKKPGDGE